MVNCRMWHSSCLHRAVSLTHSVTGVVQCMCAIMFRMSQMSGFEFGMNVFLGLVNIPLGCLMLTVLKKRKDCRSPREYVVHNRLSLVLLWHSVVFNGLCASVIYFLASGQPVFDDITSFYVKWRRFINHLFAASFSVALVLSLLSAACMLAMCGSPLRHVLPGDSYQDDGNQGLQEETLELDKAGVGLYDWVFRAPLCSVLSTPKTSTGRRDPGFSRPRYTFCMNEAAPSSLDTLAVPSTSGEQPRPRKVPRDAESDSLAREIEAVLESSPFNYSTSSDEGTIVKGASLSAEDDFDDSMIDDASPIPEDTTPSESTTVATSSTVREGTQSRYLDTVVALDVDSLVNLSNLELMARQYRTSATLRRIWKTSEERTSPR